MYRTRILKLSQYLDEMKQLELTPSSIGIGYKSKDGSCTESHYPDYGPAMPMSKIFPDDWIENLSNLQVLKSKPNSPPFVCICHYLDIDIQQYMHLFVAYFQDLERYSGVVIFHEDVRPQIIAFQLKEMLNCQLPF